MPHGIVTSRTDKYAAPALGPGARPGTQRRAASIATIAAVSLPNKRLIQAILIAKDLHAQFRKVATSIAATSGPPKPGRDNSLADSHVENLVGQANQLYDGMWSHLDDASRELSEAGNDVSEYSALRSEAGPHGVIDKHASSQNIGIFARRELVANQQGAANAERAIQLLQSLAPEIDWWAAEAESNAMVVDVSGNAKTLTTVVIVGLALVVLAAIAAAFA